MTHRKVGQLFILAAGILICGCGGSLQSAARECDIARVGVLLEQGAPVDEKDSEGFTALHRAAYSGCGLQLTLLLLKHDADVNARDPHARTPLHLCFIYSLSTYEVQDALLQHGANVDAQDSNGDTPLHLAAWRGDSDGVQLLLKHGANHRITNADGLDAVALAQESYERDDSSRNPSKALKNTQNGRAVVIKLIEDWARHQ